VKSKTYDNVERDWARVGVLFGCEPSHETPDLERLLIDTARKCPDNARLLPLAVTWLVEYGQFVARHRLKRLVQTELEPEPQAVLGLIIEEAVRHGATRELLIVSEECHPLSPAAPLSRAQRDNASVAHISERRASELSQKWGVWTPPVELKPDAVRPVTWLLDQNNEYRERVIRKGDLRVSIIETLRRDVPGHSVASEAALSRLSGATRAAVRKALDALRLEGVIGLGRDAMNERDHPVTLRRVA
tara:strand:+ start:125328 stop:126065 length:738 start_codon:yes stop_codon:yes gene_type:complete